MSGRRQPPVPGFLPATLGELDRWIGGENRHDDDDDCELCRALRELEGQTTTEEVVLPDGSMLAITAMPPGWQPPASMKRRPS